jgi:hypothetical protein
VGPCGRDVFGFDVGPAEDLILGKGFGHDRRLVADDEFVVDFHVGFTEHDELLMNRTTTATNRNRIRSGILRDLGDELLQTRESFDFDDACHEGHARFFDLWLAGLAVLVHIYRLIVFRIRTTFFYSFSKTISVPMLQQNAGQPGMWTLRELNP